MTPAPVGSLVPLALRLAAWQRPRFTLRHADGSLYLRRRVLWGVDSLENHDASVESSAFVHEIESPDGDRHMHDHPWVWSVAVVLSGGYRERRDAGNGTTGIREYHKGDLNVLRPGEYHSIVAVEPRTATLFLCGREISDWGFLVDGCHVPHCTYFERPDARPMTLVREQ